MHGLGVLAVAAHEDVLAGLFGHGVDAEEGAQGEGVSVNEQEGFVLCSHSSSVSSLSLLGGWVRDGKLRDGRFCDDCRSALRACPVAGQSYGEAPVPY